MIRWQHPEKGLLFPDSFIPLAEETGLIVPMGKFVIEEACLQIQRWKQAGIEPVPISINVSAAQFEPHYLTKFIQEKLSESNVDPEYLIIEITESVAMHDMEVSVQILTEMREMGVKIALDDFGVGYSSLNCLMRFPIDTLKIDRSFVSEVVVSSKKAAILEAIITVAQTLNFTVVAEGVETQDQLSFLRKRGCDLIQGYLFSRPVPEDLISEFMISGFKDIS